MPALRFEHGRCSTANLGRPDATAAVFTDDGWYRTGDVAAIDAGGMHRIVGRESTDLIKTGGYRVGAAEVETALLGHEGVSEAAVVGLPDDDLGRIVALVVGDAKPDELIDYVAQQLSVRKRPREVRGGQKSSAGRTTSTKTATWFCTRPPHPARTGCFCGSRTSESSRTASTSTSCPTTSRSR